MPNTTDNHEHLILKKLEEYATKRQDGSSMDVSFVQHLRSSDLKLTDCESLDISGMDLSHCNLDKAHLVSAVCEGVNFKFATYHKTNIENATLSYARGLKPSELAKALWQKLNIHDDDKLNLKIRRYALSIKEARCTIASRFFRKPIRRLSHDYDDAIREWAEEHAQLEAETAQITALLGDALLDTVLNDRQKSTSSTTLGEITMMHTTTTLATTTLPLWATMQKLHLQIMNLKRDTQAIVQAIADDPLGSGLEQNGLTHQLMQRHLDGENEATILAFVSNMDTRTLAGYDIEHDTHSALGYYIFHWCALFNYVNLATYLKNKGWSPDIRSQQQYTPSHLAAVLGRQEFLLEQLNERPEFSDMITVFQDGSNQHTVKMNELHLAILGRQLYIVQDIFNLFHRKHINVSSKISGLGNVLHLAIHARLLERAQCSAVPHTAPNLVADEANAMDTPNAQAIDNLRLILSQYPDDVIRTMLTETSPFSNAETPLVLAAKHGLGGMLHVLIQALFVLEQHQGFELVTEAFYAAAQADQFDVVEMLLDYHRCNPSSADKEYHATMCYLEAHTGDPKTTYRSIKNRILDAAKKKRFGQYNPSEPKIQSYRNLVLSGGGGKGFSLPYGIQAFKAICVERSQSSVISNPSKAALSFDALQRVAGTSAGAIFAMALAIGFTPDELEAKLDYDFSDFLESDAIKTVVEQMNLTQPDHQTIVDGILREFNSTLDRLRQTIEQTQASSHPLSTAMWEAITHPVSLYQDVKAAIVKLKALYKDFTGFCTGRVAKQFLIQLLEEKNIPSDTTFGEWAKEVKADQTKYKHLHVVVTNLSQGRFEVLSSENPIYRNYLIVDAVRASMSYPIVFAPHHLYIKTGARIHALSDEYVDGGVLRNYPIDEFDFKRYTERDAVGDPCFPIHNRETLGFRFTDAGDTGSAVEADTSQANILSRLRQFMSIYGQAESVIGEHQEREYHRSIVLNTVEQRSQATREPDTNTAEPVRITTFTFKRLENHEKAFLARSSTLAVQHFFNKPNPTHGRRTDTDNEAGPANPAPQF